MKIDRTNYEIFFIDYLDGKLSVEEVSMLLVFLEQNPDLKEELENINGIALVAEDAIFSDKNSLYKNEIKLNNKTIEFEEACIAYHENDLSLIEKGEMLTIISSDKSKEKIFDTYAKTKLTPFSSDIYKEKNKLKKLTINSRSIIVWSLSAAAAIALLILFSTGTFKPLKNQEQNLISHTTNKNISPIKNKSLLVKQSDANNVKQEKSILSNINNSTAQNKNQNTANALQLASIDTTSKQKIKIDSEKTFEKIQPYLATLSANCQPQENFISRSITSLKSENVQNEKVQSEPVKELTASEFIFQKIKKGLGIKEKSKENKTDKWDVLATIVRGVNKLTGKSMRLDKKYNDKGELENLAFHAGGLEITRNFEK